MINLGKDVGGESPVNRRAQAWSGSKDRPIRSRRNGSGYEVGSVGRQRRALLKGPTDNPILRFRWKSQRKVCHGNQRDRSDQLQAEKANACGQIRGRNLGRHARLLEKALFDHPATVSFTAIRRGTAGRLFDHPCGFQRTVRRGWHPEDQQHSSNNSTYPRH